MIMGEYKRELLDFVLVSAMCKFSCAGDISGNR